MLNNVQELLEKMFGKLTKLGEMFLAFGRLDTNKKCCLPLKSTQSTLISHYDALQDLVIVVEYFVHLHRTTVIFASEQHQKRH